MYSRSNIGAIYATDPENKATNHFLYETCNALIKLKKSKVRRHKILHACSESINAQQQISHPVMSHLRGNILKTNTVIHSNNRNG